MQNEEHWDLEIKPQDNILNFHLKDVWRYRDLLILLVRRDFVSFYKQTIFGPLWFFIQPIFTTITFTIIFGGLAKMSTDNAPPPLFYMSGIIVWNYFAECLNKTSTVFRDNAGIFGKVYFPRLIMPLSIIISNLVKFAVQFLLFILMTVYYVVQGSNVHPNLFILLFPFIIFFMALLGLGSGLIITALTTKYRDLTFLITFGVQLLMYASAVILPMSSALTKYNGILAYNPLCGLIETFRFSFLGTGTFYPGLFTYSIICSIAIFFLGLIIFNRVEKNFVDTI